MIYEPPKMKPFDLHIGDVIYCEYQDGIKRKATVVDISKHVFTVTTGKYKMAFRKLDYKLGLLGNKK